MFSKIFQLREKFILKKSSSINDYEFNTEELSTKKEIDFIFSDDFIYHVSGWPQLSKLKIGDSFVLNPGPQGAEGKGVYFSEDYPRLTAAEGAKGNPSAIIAVPKPLSKKEWFTTKPGLAKRYMFHKINMKNLKTYLKNLGACPDSLEWARTRKTSKAAWLACPRADWLLWLAPRIGIDKNLIILAACDVAESVLHLVPENEERPRKAIETARAFVANKATIEEAHAAARAAYTASNEAADTSAVNAVDNVVYTAYAAYAIIHDAPDAARHAAFNTNTSQELSNIVRKRIPWKLWKENLL